MTPVVTADPTTWPVALFGDALPFEHFHNSDHNACFGCNSAKMLVRPIGDTTRHVLMPATLRLAPGDFRVFPFAWLLFPRPHIVSFEQLPDDWTRSQQAAVAILRRGGVEVGNICQNLTGPGGKTAEHVHDWLIARDQENGLLCANRGLATILALIKEYQIA